MFTQELDIPLLSKRITKLAQMFLKGAPGSISREDLEQSGWVGVSGAVKTYDVEKGAAFYTYASTRAKGEMIDELRRNGRPRLRSDGRLGERSASHRPMLISTVGLFDINFLTDASPERQLSLALKNDRFDWLPLDSKEFECDTAQEKRVIGSDLLKALSCLNPVESRVCTMLLEDETLTYVAEILGVTLSRASQIKAQIIKKLRRRML